MRLTEKETKSISSLAKDFFGTNAQVKLFGSRVDDQKRGGDIDLLVIVPSADLKKAKSLKYKFIYELQGFIGEQRIDLIITTNERMKTDKFLSSIKAVEIV